MIGFKRRSFFAIFCAAFLCVSVGYAEQRSEVWCQTGYHPTKERDDLYRLHKNARTHIYGPSASGTLMELMDGSLWKLNESDRHLVHGWYQNDVILIKPQVCWLKPERYVLHNYTSKETVRVNLETPPAPHQEQTLFIIRLNPYARLVQLSDNSVWQVGSDGMFDDQWEVGQRVLVGVNNKWRTGAYPHILINADSARKPHKIASYYGEVFNQY